MLITDPVVQTKSRGILADRLVRLQKSDIKIGIRCGIVAFWEGCKGWDDRGYGSRPGSLTGHALKEIQAIVLPISFVTPKKEQFVFNDGPSHRTTKLV